MKTAGIAAVILIIIVMLGGGVWYQMSSSAPAMDENSAAGTVPEGTGTSVDASNNPVGVPSDARPSSASGQAGVNGSTNQGDMGEPSTGVVQTPGATQGIAVGEPNPSTPVIQEPGADGAEGTVIGNNVALGTDGNSALGTYLIAYNGMTLYLYTKDTTKESVCYDTCAVNWPPYIVGAEDNVENVKSPVDAKKVGTTIRKDGKIQVTYDGHPLYFWKNDKKSGDTTGQNVGGVWFVLKP